jgi:citrate lyase beta subunit
LDNTVPQTQTANTIQTVATLEKKIQADNQAIDEETQAAETVKQIVQKEQVKTSSVVSSSLLIEISFDCSDSLSVGGPLWLVVFGFFP